MSARRRVLLLHPSAELYGADRTLLQWVEGLRDAGYAAHVLLPRSGPLVEALERAGAEVEVVPLGVGSQATATPRGLLRFLRELPGAVAAVRRAVRRLHPVLVHTNTIVVPAGALAAKLARVPHLWHVHEIPTRPWVSTVVARLLALLADRVVFNSHATRAHFVAHRPELAHRATVVWNGTRLAPEDGRALATPRSREDAAHGPHVLLLGRVNRWKGHALLLEAARTVLPRHPGARLVLAGDAPPGQEHLERDLARRIEASGLGARIDRLPFQVEPRPLLEAADVVVVPSTRPEPFGLVAIEAMAAGKPVIAADHGGLAEVVVDGETGRRFAPGDAGELARALDELLGDAVLRARLGQAGRERVRRHFDEDAYRRGLRACYASLLGSSEPDLPAGTPVVHLTLGKANPLRLNGVNAVVHHLASAQRAAGREVEVWGLSREPEAPTPARPYALRLFRRHRLGCGLSPELRRALLGAPRPTVFHLHGCFHPELVSAARLLAGAHQRFVVTPHGALAPGALRAGWLRKRAFLALCGRTLLGRAHRVQAFTASEARELAGRVDAGRLAVLANGHAIPAAWQGRGRLRILRPERTPVFGSCGRLASRAKGLDLLIEGFVLYRRQGGQGRLEVIGAGPDRGDLEHRALRAGPDACRFLGPLFGEELWRALAALDALVVPSRHEGLPVTPLDAAALGVPLIVSTATHLGEDVRDHGAGLVLDALHPEAIADALFELEADVRAGRDQARAAGAARMAAARFDWERLVPEATTGLYGVAGATRAPDAHRASGPEAGVA